MILDRRTLLASLGAGLLGGCAGPFGMAALDPDPDREGGIGGTGIVGTLTDYGSLIVNGLRVEIDGDTRISDTRGTVREDSLRIGQLLTVKARPVDGVLRARSVQITYPVTGIATGVSPDGRRAHVSGIRVYLEPTGLGGFEEGAAVVVSGIWDGPRVVASRVDRVRAMDGAILSGAVHLGENGAYRLGDVPLDGLTAGDVEPGGFARVAGRYRGDRLAVDGVVPGRFLGDADPLVALSVEGYLDAVPQAPFYRVSGLGHSFDEEARLRPFAAHRTLFTGAYTGTFAVQRGLVLPEAFKARRAVMRQVLRADPRAVGRSAR